MNFKQLKLSSFFGGKGGKPADSESDSSDDSEYVGSKRQLKYQTPMYWTRVKEVYVAKGKRLDLFNVEDDLKNDKQMKAIRRITTQDIGELLFDPNDFDNQKEHLLIDNYKLDKEDMAHYATLASKIRHKISMRANLLDEDGNELKLNKEEYE